jgi:PAS domain S-box-containing protein
MLGESIEVLIPPADLAIERARLRLVAEGGTESGCRCTRIRADGQAINVVMSMSAVRDDTDRVVGVASISRTVSDKEYADARFASLLEAAPDAMFCVDTRGRVVMANAKAGELFGYADHQLVGAPVELLMPKAMRQRHSEHFDEFFRRPIPRGLGDLVAPLTARRRDGSTFPVEISLSADTSGTGVLAIAAVRDVTATYATAAALAEQESRLRQLAESTEITFILRQIDPPRTLYVGPGLPKLTGSTIHDPNDDAPMLVKFLHPDDRARVEAVFHGLTAGTLPTSVEYRIIRTDGEVRWIRTSVTAVINPDGPTERLVSTTQDITERIEAKQALQEAEAIAQAANTSKNDFLSRMSHELRTPLNAILGFGQILETRLQGSDDGESAEQVVQAGRHLLNLINEVLDFARIEAGDISVSLEDVDVGEILGETVLLMQPLADAAGVTMTVEGGPDGTSVHVDRQRLRQILLNLISNSIKYNHVGGGVWLAWTNDAGSGRSIVVRDGGKGIPADLYDRLFTPFDRLGAEASEVEGTGVGLTVTRNLVELMNGTLTFESVLGVGTTFFVSLPATVGPPVSTAQLSEDAGAVRKTDPHSLTLLLIEDNEANVRVMEQVVKLRPEWQFIHAGLTTLGIELAGAHQPDLVLTDANLPDGSGHNVITALTTAELTAHIPVVVLSADAGQQQIDSMLAAGATKYLTKPFDLDDMLALLDSIAAARPAGQIGSTPAT